MKNIAVIICLGMITPMLFGQKVVEKKMDFNNKKVLVLNLQITDSILIETWNKNEVDAYASININDNKDNEAYETSFSETADRVEISTSLNNKHFSKGDCCCNDIIIWKLKVPEDAQLNIKTINGNIEIKGTIASVKANSISGFIDLGIPSDKKADLEMKTISGNIYTDLNLASTGKARIAELKIAEQINGGGVPIHLETISGDIFLRKTN